MSKPVLDKPANCFNCVLYHQRKEYCSLDGKQHAGCFHNYMPMGDKKVEVSDELVS